MTTVTTTTRYCSDCRAVRDVEPKNAGKVTERADGKPRMTDAQRDRLWQLCGGLNVPFREDDYAKTFDLPDGWVAGWIGGPTPTSGGRQTIYVGVSPEGAAHS